ncbi:MAG: anthranilate synthase component I [Puniceicoccaceae bacterium]|nr:anthranilate synthase component I [Puniceicoccaceae bacterium]
MEIQPTPDTFKSLAKPGTRIPIFMEMTADCETPLSAYAKLSQEKPAFLFESIVGGENISRYSFLGVAPKKIFRIFQDTTTIEGKNGETESFPTPSEPLDLIEKELAGFQTLENKALPPFDGGAVGFVGHEFIHTVEPSIQIPETDPLKLPILYYMITDSVLIFDHVKQVLTICVYAEVEDSADRAYQQAAEEIKRIFTRLQEPPTLRYQTITEPETGQPPKGNFERDEFKTAVEKIKAYIQAGDVIQTVLSQRFSKDFKPPATALYRALRTINPSPYMFLLEDPAFSVVGASPEIHVRLTGKQIEIRPIAGTRRRGRTESEDLELETDLLSDQKECAEHLMLVDLARNDIGRVSEFGSVEVSDYMTIERYSHVMHIVSQVQGQLASDKTAYDLMKATFPAGTLSGAPKVRALQIISELENSRRGLYGGALGYFSYKGNHDSCIGIRTAVIQNQSIYIQSGAGVVADSIPEEEYIETLNKAKAMFKAVSMAEQMFTSEEHQP